MVGFEVWDDISALTWDVVRQQMHGQMNSHVRTWIETGFWNDESRIWMGSDGLIYGQVTDAVFTPALSQVEEDA